LFGTYHITNRGYTTWFEFAQKIFELSGAKTRVLPCTTEEFPRPAPRPRNSRLSPRFYENALGNRMPTWEEGLKKYLNNNLRVTSEKKRSFDTIRAGYPRAYIAWTPEEDEELKQEFNRHLQIREIAAIHRRKSGAIRSRLRKLKLID
jgi:hypothetical protein